MDRNRFIKQAAVDLGFSGVGICSAVPSPGFERLLEWLEAGYAGEMTFFARRRNAYADPCHVMQGVRSIVMLTLDYRTADPQPTAIGFGRISRYAWGEVDYHDWLHDRLKVLAQRLGEAWPELVCRGVVDTAPLMERDFARRAGIGWTGKHTLTLNREQGSYFFLAALLLNLDVAADAEFAHDHCGTCTACLDSCPTSAFPAPYVLDATRCISYLTIEHRSEIDPSLRPLMGDWIFGCDVCQDVCPWNRKAPRSEVPAFAPRPGQNPISLDELCAMDEGEFRARFRETPLWRARYRGILRNAAIALGNQPASENIGLLGKLLASPEPLVRGAAAWSLGRHLGFLQASAPLARLLETEADATVRREIEEALAALQAASPGEDGNSTHQAHS